MKKRIAAMLLCLCMAAVLFPSTALAGDPVASGACGAAGNEANVTWVLEDNGTLTISGSGAMADYNRDPITGESSAPWNGYKAQITSMVFSGITNVGNSSAYNFDGLTSVTLSDTINSIGEFAFSECVFSSVSIPANVTSIGRNAFSSCAALTSVVIPAGVTVIDSTIFGSCTALTEVTFNSLPSSVASEEYGKSFKSTNITKIKYICAIDEAALAAKLTPGGVSAAAVYEPIHAWDSGTVTTPPTAKNEGVKTFACTRCSATKTEAIQKTEAIPKLKSYGATALQHGTGGIGEGDTVYFGKYTANGTDYDVPWTVLSGTALSGTRVAAGTAVLPLFSTYTLGEVVFRQTLNNGFYDGSALQVYLQDTVFASFDSREKDAVVETTLIGSSMETRQADLAAQRLFPLSYTEAEAFTWRSAILQAKSITAPTTGSRWWMRSCSDVDAGLVFEDGQSGYYYAYVTNIAARPALNLDTNAVLFASAAANGKASGSGATALTAVSTATPTAWKLTITDSARSAFTATTTGRTGDVLTISYSGATTGANEYISAVVKNNADEITYYGRLAAVSAADGTVNIDLSGVTMAATDTLCVFNEQYNGDNKTDYAGKLQQVAIPAATAASPATGDNGKPGVWLVATLFSLLCLTAALTANGKKRKHSM